MGLSSQDISQPKSGDGRSEIDEDLAALGGGNAKIDLLLEKMDILEHEIMPEKLEKFEAHINEHQKIFEAKIKKSTNDKMDKNAKGVVAGEKRAEKLQTAVKQLSQYLQPLQQQVQQC